jgi:DNA-binding NarL/FixJ family response regulator
MLTKKQTEILDYIVEGYSIKDIAEKLGVKRDTVDKRLNRAYKNLGVKNLVNAVARYLTNYK